ncbi:MAG: ATPase, T2SS/T4P/T4SS family [bacterium]
MLGKMLVDEQMVTEEQLEDALAEQRKTGDPLGEVMVRQGHLSEEALYRFLAIQHGLDFEHLEQFTVTPDLLKVIPGAAARRYQAMPIERRNGTIKVATSAADDLSLFNLPKEIKLPPDTQLKLVITTPSEIKPHIAEHFPDTGPKGSGEIQTRETAAVQAVQDTPEDNSAAEASIMESVEQELMDAEDLNIELLDAEKKEDQDDTGKDEGLVAQMCNFIIIDAVRKRASDIHITPYEKRISVRYRVDGALFEQKSPPVAMMRRLAARFKILAKLNIIERRLPQDGRIHLPVDRRSVDVRIATLPTRYGENIVMRIVDQTKSNLSLDTLGFEPDQLEHFKRAISAPYGMVFVTGPTASGKTTTLFAALNYVNTPTKNIVTLEDPVEFRLPHIIQIQVDPAAGRTFESVLRAFLRHDPNIMLVGETRDKETAALAVKASMTGHMVLTSVHTNDAASTIMRLVDLGVDYVYIGSSVLAIASQRLLKRICEACKTEAPILPEELKRLGVDVTSLAGAKFYKGKGCPECNNTGYKGRLAVYEVMPITASIRELIFSKASLASLKAAAKDAGFKTLREAAVIKWKAGLTTLDEVLGETFE